jgi:hypothetical protein
MASTKNVEAILLWRGIHAAFCGINPAPQVCELAFMPLFAG